MRRHGYSLIEMTVAMTVGTVIIGVSVGALHALLRTEQTGRNRVPQAGILARLAEQFRSDVGAAVDHTADVQKGQWQFVLAGGRTVAYRVLPGKVEWDEHTAGKLVRQESYILPDDCSATIIIQNEAKPAVANLVVRDTGTPHTAIREMRVTAMLGKDHRFTKSPAGGH